MSSNLRIPRLSILTVAALALLLPNVTDLQAGELFHPRSVGSAQRGSSASTHDSGGVWVPVVRSAAAEMLDPEGDKIGDLWPVVGESSISPYLPWAVWSRPNEGEYDLVWSRWLEVGWEPVEWLAQPDLMGDDLDADLGFDESGRAHLVWWRDENGLGRIYFSMFCETQWMTPLGVSIPGRDGRFPTIIGVQQGVTVVMYETPTGTVQQTITLASGTGITDDIDPLDVVHVDEPVHISSNPTALTIVPQLNPV